MSLADFDAPQEFIPDAEPAQIFTAEEHARISRHRDQYLHSMIVYMGDLYDAGRALFAVLERFGPQMSDYERAQLLEIHGRCVYPEAASHEDVARLLEQLDAEYLVDVSEDDTGEVIAERVTLKVASPGDRHDHAHLRQEIERHGFAMVGGGASPLVRLTAVVRPNGIRRGA